MRYWVYKDSQILGPLAKEDLGLVGGVRPETLVCAEDTAGRMDVDWRCAEEVGELSSFCATAPAAAGADMLEPGFGLLERLQSETLALPGEGDGEGWLTDIFSPASRIPAADLPRPDEATRQELKDSQARIQELTAQLELLNRRLVELEAAPRQAPDALKKAPAVPPPAAARPQAPAPAQKAPAAPPSAAAPLPPPVLAPLPKVDVPAPEHIKPPVQEGPSLSPEESPYRWEQPAIGGGLPQARSALPPAPATEPLAPGAAPESPPTIKGRPRRVIKFSAPQTLRKVEKGSPRTLPAADKTPGPAALPPPLTAAPGLKPEESPYQWGPQPTPGGNLPQAGSAPLPAPSAAGLAPIELSAPPATIVPGAFPPPLTAPPQPVLPPPPAAIMPATFMQPLTAPPVTLSTLARSMEVPPVPTLAPTAPAPAVLPPMTMAFSGGAVMPAPAAGPSTQEVLAKLAKPAPAKTEPPQPPKSRSKAFLIIIAAASVVVIAAGWFFLFRDSKGLKTALRMDSGRSPVGAEVSEESTRAAKPAAAAPAPQAAAQTVTTVTPPTAPPPKPLAPAPQAEAIRDERPAAVTLVKEFPLDGDRGTIGQWLQYSFAATPGVQNEEKWDAGAYEESTYAVKYTVQPAGKDAITYLFEADLARKTVKGMNATARELLAGRSPARGKATAKARPAKPKKRTPPRRTVAPAPIPKEVPLLPLPSDAELTPPTEDEAAFRSDTVRPNL